MDRNTENRFAVSLSLPVSLHARPTLDLLHPGRRLRDHA
jgi:hypothetical protein